IRQERVTTLARCKAQSGSRALAARRTASQGESESLAVTDPPSDSLRQLKQSTKLRQGAAVDVNAMPRSELQNAEKDSTTSAADHCQALQAPEDEARRSGSD